jgi:Dolichyl-phosphate-mannose-protein mannosyltransferase
MPRRSAPSKRRSFKPGPAALSRIGEPIGKTDHPTIQILREIIARNAAAETTREPPGTRLPRRDSVDSIRCIRTATSAFWPIAALSAGLAMLTALRLALAASMALTPDEAYYWVWSRALAAGYFDHPPMVAFWIRAGTWLAGDTALGIRLLGPLTAALGSALLWDAANRLLPGRKAGIVAVSFLNATLLAGVGAIVMTPDTPLLLFWTFAFWAMSRIISGGPGAWWLVVGLFVGLALQSKYTAVLLAIGIALWLAAAARQWLRRREPYAGAALALVIATPVLWWNAAHQWVGFLRQGERAGDWSPDRAPQYLLELFGGQIAVATPLIFSFCMAGTVLATRSAWRTRDPQPLARCGFYPACARRSGPSKLACDHLSRRCRRGGGTERAVLARPATSGDRTRLVDDRCCLCSGGFHAVVAAPQTRSDRVADARLARSRRRRGRGASPHRRALRRGGPIWPGRRIGPPTPLGRAGDRHWAALVELQLAGAGNRRREGHIGATRSSRYARLACCRGDWNGDARPRRRRHPKISTLSSRPRPLDERRIFAAPREVIRLCAVGSRGASTAHRSGAGRNTSTQAELLFSVLREMPARRPSTPSKLIDDRRNGLRRCSAAKRMRRRDLPDLSAGRYSCAALYGVGRLRQIYLRAKLTRCRGGRFAPWQSQPEVA